MAANIDGVQVSLAPGVNVASFVAAANGVRNVLSQSMNAVQPPSAELKRDLTNIVLCGRDRSTEVCLFFVSLLVSEISCTSIVCSRRRSSMGADQLQEKIQ